MRSCLSLRKRPATWLRGCRFALRRVAVSAASQSLALNPSLADESLEEFDLVRAMDLLGGVWGAARGQCAGVARGKEQGPQCWLKVPRCLHIGVATLTAG